ncbi:hypothetical protein TNCV_3491 [Trichonephila clavipes]|nr:hypothetical protein TNCV_3491 [Trichonephila clavipes]
MYTDQTIKITPSCNVRMMAKSVVSVAAIVGYNHCHMPRHRIKEALDISLEYSSHVASAYCQIRPGVSRASRFAKINHMFSRDRENKQAKETI